MKQSPQNFEPTLAVLPKRGPADAAEQPLVSQFTGTRPTGRPATMRQIARIAKVSPATVSLVLNQNPRISLSTQNRVRRVMDQLGYRPNRAGYGQSSTRAQALAVMLPALNLALADRYFGMLISGICERAFKLNYRVMLEQATPEFVKNQRHIELFERRVVDGILCLCNTDRHSFLTDFAERQYPMITVNNYFPEWNLDFVVSDYSGGADQVMDYLFQLGHRRIAMINGLTSIRTARDQVERYEHKLRSVGSEPEASWREDGQFTQRGGAEAAEKLIARHPDLTAIFAGNDNMAIGAMYYLNRIGKRVPQDVTVVGFDDWQDTVFANEELTTVHLPLAQVGALACDRLVERIQGRTDPVRDVLATHLKVRHTSGLAREANSHPR
ncbi:MAG TPA: LacI family DNA-binding transcriptional regulator [Tepidisphaeraceae bacterium]|nr:LacI family DNA-binding transcriptional regulator [Tepidisphaeraceae bacterium]